MEVLMEEWVLMFNYIVDRAPQLSFCATVMYVLFRLFRWLVDFLYTYA